MDAKFEVMSCGTIVAPFETDAEVAAYRLEHADAIVAYHASQVPAAQPVSRNTPTKLGAMLLGIEEPEPQTELSPVASLIFDSQAMEVARAMKSIGAKPAFA